MILTRNFTLQEMIFSQEAARAGIRNEPTAAQVENLRVLCERILQPLRDHLRRPVVVTSGFRSATVNRRIGGARGSQHIQGMAADIYVPNMSTAELMDKIQTMHLPFDQLIGEFGWVHVSHDRTRAQRGEILRARIEAGKTVYQPLQGV